MASDAMRELAMLASEHLGYHSMTADAVDGLRNLASITGVHDSPLVPDARVYAPRFPQLQRESSGDGEPSLLGRPPQARFLVLCPSYRVIVASFVIFYRVCPRRGG
jgi:hypothetical protein